MKLRFFTFHFSLFTIPLFLLCALSVHSQEYTTLNLHLKNGDIIHFALDSQLKIVATSPSQLTIESAGYTIHYPVSDIRKFTAGDDTVPARIILAEGWNWMSHNLSGALPVSRFSAAQQILSEKATAYNDPVLGFVGSLTTLTSAEGYKVNMTETAIYDFDGLTALPGTPTINLHPGWNWTGYPLSLSLPLSTALSDAQWSEGDCIAAQDAFATYTDGQWQGSLQTLTPHQCYLIKTRTAQSFTYNTQTQAKPRITVKPQLPNRKSSNYPIKYPNNMNIVARLAQPVSEGYTLTAYADTELRGTATIHGDSPIYLTVHGTGNELIRFQLTDPEGHHSWALQTLPFTDDLIGTHRAPYTLTFTDDTTPISQTVASTLQTEPISIYTTSGLLLKTVTPQPDGTLDIQLNQLPTGIYILKSRTINCKVQVK